MKVFKWIHKIVHDYYMYRKYLSPKEAERKSQKFGAIMYALLAWQFMGYAIYLIMNENIPKDKQELKRKLDYDNTKTLKVIQLEGMRLINEYDELIEDDPEEYVEVVSKN